MAQDIEAFQSRIQDVELVNDELRVLYSLLLTFNS